MRGTRILAALAATAALLLTAPAALGAFNPARYASPTGSGTACTSTNPCGIVQAINAAGGSDHDVIVTPGDYGTAGSPITTALTSSVGIDLHGEDGQPRPRI